jgi:hypothetical protein
MHAWGRQDKHGREDDRSHCAAIVTDIVTERTGDVPTGRGAVQPEHEIRKITSIDGWGWLWPQVQIDGFEHWSNRWLWPLVKSIYFTIGQINGFDHWSNQWLWPLVKAMTVGQIDGCDHWWNRWLWPLVKSMALTNGQIAAHRDGADPEAGRRGVVQVPDALDHHVWVGEDAFQAVGDGVERLEENSAPIT